MKRIDLLYGAIIGFLTAILGSFLFLKIFTSYDFAYGIQVLKSKGLLGKLMAVGALLNLVIYFVLLKIHKELMARGVVLAILIVTIITLFL